MAGNSHNALLNKTKKQRHKRSKMPDQTDDGVSPRSYQALGSPSHKKALSGDHYANSVSVGHWSDNMDKLASSHEGFTEVRNSLDLVMDIRQKGKNDSVRKRHVSNGGGDGGLIEPKRVKLTYGTDSVPEHEVVIVRKVDFDEIKHLESTHADIVEEKNGLLKSYKQVNNDLQRTISTMAKDLAELQQRQGVASGRPSLSSRLFGTNNGVQQSDAALTARIHELEDHVSDQNARLKHQEQENVAARAEFTKEIMELRSLPARSTFKVSDNEITDKWEGLSYRIKQFVSRNFPPCLEPTITEIEEWKALCLDPATFLKHSVLAPWLYEAWVWRQLEVWIFRRESRLWARGLSKDYTNTCLKVEDIVYENTEFLNEYHDWRARSVEFINRLCPTDDKTLMRFASKILERLPRSLKLDVAALSNEMLEIVTDAAELDLIFRKSKAEFTVDVAGLDYDKSLPYKKWMNPKSICGVMKKCSSTTESTDLIFSPVLYKRGTSDGNSYDRVSTLIKASVVLNVHAQLRKLAGEGDDSSGNGYGAPKEEKDGDGDVRMFQPVLPGRASDMGTVATAAPPRLDPGNLQEMKTSKSA